MYCAFYREQTIWLWIRLVGREREGDVVGPRWVLETTWLSRLSFEGPTDRGGHRGPIVEQTGPLGALGRVGLTSPSECRVPSAERQLCPHPGHGVIVECRVPEWLGRSGAAASGSLSGGGAGAML